MDHQEVIEASWKPDGSLIEVGKVGLKANSVGGDNPLKAPLRLGEKRSRKWEDDLLNLSQAQVPLWVSLLSAEDQRQPEDL
jgi:hypothetical protein